ncbi:MAG: right-handed parallel beta-helix repeat-containing protein [Deltaproteobacteria bacterium]|nr:right-handed parallel beta-helix repeat-containing protein [Deltaproteobacteria bacterium]
MNAVRSLVVVLLAFVTWGEVASAQDCGCDHMVALDVQTVDGDDLGYAPGDRVCVMAGEREFIRFRHLTGTADEPIEIINCGGLVRIHNEERAYALVFEDDSQHFHLTGTGDPALTYGFEISAPDREPYPGVGLWLLGRSTNYEVDHVEIHDTGFAGVSAKTDPLCDGSADQGTFTQRDVSFHHMYVHDTIGEGFYIGSTQANGQTINCEGSSETHQPHFLEGVRLTDNLIENTGWDGAQIGMAREGCVVARNVIRNVGLEGEEFQQQGLQIGSFSQCEIHRNRLESGPTNGIFVLEADDTWVHDNVIVDFEGDGIYANVRDRFEGKRYRFHHNTIVGSGGNALRVFGGILGPSEALSNLAVGPNGGISAGGDVDWTAMGNVEVAEGGFVSDGDYRITMDSPARGAGVSVDMLDLDFEGYPRPDPPSAGAFEYRDPDVDAGFTPSDGGVLPARDGGGSDGGGDGDGGCGCRASGGAPLGGLWVLLAMLFVRRRR